MFVTYSLAYLDRSNFSIAVAGGMKEDLDITAGVSRWSGRSSSSATSPSRSRAHLRRAPQRQGLIFWSLIAWGVLASLQGLLTSPWALIVVRFSVGVVEAAVLPAMVILLATGSPAERGRANTFLILGNPVTVLWLSAVSGYLVEATCWRGMFIIEGMPADHLGLRLPALSRTSRATRSGWTRGRAQHVEAGIAAEQAGP